MQQECCAAALRGVFRPSPEPQRYVATVPRSSMPVPLLWASHRPLRRPPSPSRQRQLGCSTHHDKVDIARGIVRVDKVALQVAQLDELVHAAAQQRRLRNGWAGGGSQPLSAARARAVRLGGSAAPLTCSTNATSHVRSSQGIASELLLSTV